MAQIPVSFFRRKSNPMSFAVTPDQTGRILPDPDDWNFMRAGTIDPADVQAFPDAEIHTWLRAFQQTGYCLLDQIPVGGAD
jgi:hypothetical protein